MATTAITGVVALVIGLAIGFVVKGGIKPAKGK
jgi:uncharacterized membrane-anchored protein YhcB (DUF1043 family)